MDEENILEIFGNKVLYKPEDNPFISPIENSQSNCYGCTAGMCDHLICRGEQYFWEKTFRKIEE